MQIEPLRLDLQVQNRASKTRIVSKWFCFQTGPINYIVGFLLLVTHFRQEILIDVLTNSQSQVNFYSWYTHMRAKTKMIWYFTKCNLEYVSEDYLIQAYRSTKLYEHYLRWEKHTLVQISKKCLSRDTDRPID